MAKTRSGGIALGWAALLMALAQPVLAQETPQQHNAANAENRRHSEAQNQLRLEMHELRNDRAKALLQCQGAGSAAARQACLGNVDINLRPRGLDLDNQIIQERNNHNLILKGIGVHRVP